MAKKTAAKKKSTTKKTTVSPKKRDLSVGLYKEKNPECHVATGKYKFFYVLFAVTTVLFAVVAVQLFVFSSDVMSKYESIRVCARNHTSCSVEVDDGSSVVEE